MLDIFKKVRVPFANELAKEGDVWRIFRIITFVDLIKLSFFYFQKDKLEKHLIDIFNYSMKVKLLSKINTIEVKGTLDEFSKNFNLEPEFIQEQYDTIFYELEPKFKNYTSKTLYDLNEKIQYIKVINELKLDSYADDVFEDIIGITYNLLQEN